MYLGLVFLFISSSLSCFVYHPFDEFVDVDNALMERYVGTKGEDAYRILKACYEQRYRYIYAKNNVVIPKIIHQIWLGSAVPEQFDAFRESCRRMHPDWTYILWTQHDVHKLPIKNKDYFYASRNPGERSDILRYEILYTFGGVYLDCDISCLSSLDELNESFDFYIGLQPFDTGYVQLGIGVIGATPHHPIIAAVRDSMAQYWSNPDYAGMATARTGPLYCTRIFLHAYEQSERSIVLPSFYFYPLASQSFDIKTQTWSNAGAYTIHHWAKSWLMPQFRREVFRAICNY